MKVKLLTQVCGIHGNFPPGPAELPDDYAEGLIAECVAVPVEEYEDDFEHEETEPETDA
jgi:hypothetical protein